jgi:hypothetical protein
MSFDGKSRSRTVSYRGASTAADAHTLVETARRERERREGERQSARAALALGSWFRGRSAWRRASAELRAEFDKRVADITRTREVFATIKRPFAVPLKNALPLLRAAAAFVSTRCAGDAVRLQSALELLADGVSSSVDGISMSGLLLSSDTAGTWNHIVR